jgi:hypothetical protein
MRRNVLFLLSCTSGAAIQLMATAAPAEAAYRFVAGVHCTIDKSSYPTASVGEQGRYTPWGHYTTCALPTDEVLPPASISYLEVNGQDASNTFDVQVKACVTFYTQNGGYCGDPSSSGNAYTGMYALTPDLYAFEAYPDDYAFVEVYLPATNPGPYIPPSSVAGIYYE